MEQYAHREAATWIRVVDEQGNAVKNTEFQDRVHFLRDFSNDFVRALLQNDLEYMNLYMNKMTEDVFSSFDTGRHPSGQTEPERFYHGFAFEGKKVLIGADKKS